MTTGADASNTNGKHQKARASFHNMQSNQPLGSLRLEVEGPIAMRFVNKGTAFS